MGQTRNVDESTNDGAAGDESFARPDGVSAGFESRSEPQPYRPPPPTVAPEDAQTYRRPESGSDFAPQPGQRLQPRHVAPPPVPNVLRDTFAASSDASGGFAPAPGTRMPPTGPPAQSPWWKPDAIRDPWRDPSSPFWLGRGAVFTGGGPAQLDPMQDTAVDGDGLPIGSNDDGVDEEVDDGRRGGSDNVRRVRFGLPTLVITLVVALLAGLVGGGAGWLLTRTTADGLHRPDVSIATVDGPKVERPAKSVAGIAKRVGPAVVSIAVKTPTEYAIGSGVVIDSDGDVLTNNHVISGAVGVKKASIVVTFSNEDTAKAQIVGRDVTSDLAVIKVPNDQLTVAQLGDSNTLAVGDPVIAIGSPLGLQGTVTAGIVSALHRPVHVFADDGSSDAYLDAIQTDAPINPGNSGGALVDSAGAVVGINSAAALGSSGGTSTSGIGYAIPIDYARTIALELIHTGKAIHASLGAQGRTVVAGVHVGGYLVQVSPNGPAAKAGLKSGDVIVAAAGTVIQTFDQLVVLVQQRKPGDHLPVTYYPEGASQKKTTTVVLG